MLAQFIRFLTVAAALAISLCAMRGSAEEPTPRRSLLAASKTDHTLAIVDPSTLKVIARMPVGPDPHEVIASADGKTAYVSIYGGGRLHELSIIDLVAQKALPSFDTEALLGPHGLEFNGGKVWFTAEGAKSIGRYDPATAKVDWIMGTGQGRTHMIYVTADGKHLYTTNVESGTVSIFDKVVVPPIMPPTGASMPGAKPRPDWSHMIIPVAKGCEGFDVSADGRELWTVTPIDGRLFIIDIVSKKVTDVVDAKALGANRLKFTPDGKRALISSLRTGDLAIYDTQAHHEIGRVKIGHGAAGILMDAEGGRAFVGCTADNYVAVFDLKSLKVTGHIDVGGRPDGLAWAVRP
jgi:DNA-binding beta-propeller fold protein YncE